MAVLGKVLKSGIRVGSTINQTRKLKPVKWQKKTLTKLIEKARNTQFGEKYQFTEILNDCIFGKGTTFYETYKKNVPIICGDHVTLEAGTGLVHTAPAHGLEDYAVGMQYQLPVDNPVNEEGRFYSFVEQFAGESIWAQLWTW